MPGRRMGGVAERGEVIRGIGAVLVDLRLSRPTVWQPTPSGHERYDELLRPERHQATFGPHFPAIGNRRETRSSDHPGLRSLAEILWRRPTHYRPNRPHQPSR